MQFLWVLSMIGCITGGVVLGGATLIAAGGFITAPQAAATAIISVGMGLLPYLLASSSQRSSELGQRRRDHVELLAALKAVQSQRQDASGSPPVLREVVR